MTNSKIDRLMSNSRLKVETSVSKEKAEEALDFQKNFNARVLNLVSANIIVTPKDHQDNIIPNKTKAGKEVT